MYTNNDFGEQDNVPQLSEQTTFIPSHQIQQFNVPRYYISSKGQAVSEVWLVCSLFFRFG